jgi:hypothetical protein
VETVVLWQPVGPAELALIVASALPALNNAIVGAIEVTAEFP